MDQVNTFSKIHKLDNNHLMVLVHNSYEDELSFVHFIGADPLLWFLTHSWEEDMSGPSFAVQHCTKDRSADALRMFMDVPYSDEYRSDTYIDKWSNTELIFGSEFDLLLPDVFLQEGLERLVFSRPYSKPLGIHVLPKGLRELQIIGDEDQLVDCLPLPPSLEILRLGQGGLYRSIFSVDDLPPGLIELKAGILVVGKNTLPRHLKVLDIVLFDGSTMRTDFFPKEMNSCELMYFDLSLSVLPNAKIITIDEVKGDLNFCPKGIESIVFKNYNGSLRPSIFPDSLKTLELRMFNQPLEAHVLNKGLESLSMFLFDHSLGNNVFPDSLMSIEMYSFNKPLNSDAFRLSNLQSIVMNSFNEPLRSNCFPMSLNSLEMTNFNQPLRSDCFPRSLKSLNMTYFNQPLVYGWVVVGAWG